MHRPDSTAKKQEKEGETPDARRTAATNADNVFGSSLGASLAEVRPCGATDHMGQWDVGIAPTTILSASTRMVVRGISLIEPALSSIMTGILALHSVFQATAIQASGKLNGAEASYQEAHGAFCRFHYAVFATTKITQTTRFARYLLQHNSESKLYQQQLASSRCSATRSRTARTPPRRTLRWR